jgi:hypothetical protein
MGRRYQIQAGRSLSNQFPKNLPQPLRRDWFSYLPLRDAAILTKAAPQITSGEKHTACSTLSYKTGLFPLMEHGLCRYGQHWLAAHAAGFLFCSFCPAVAGT